jgi:glycosyltransferase involved in cell wall biosynthesis
MNILVVGGMYPPMRTGTAFYTHNLAVALSSRGHRVTVVTLESDMKDEASGLDVRRLPALRLPIAGFFKHFQLCSLLPSNWSQLSNIADETQAEVILLVNHYLDIAFPAAFAARRRRIPMVCSVGTQLQSLNKRRDRFLNIMDRLVCGRFVFPFCDRVIAWDTQIRRYLADVHGDPVIRKTVIVNYGVNGDPSSFLSHKHDYELKGIILGVGAVSEQRSFVPLVRAFANLATDYPRLRLRVVGHVYYDEALRVAVELGVADRTEFVGELPHEQVIAEMCGADVLYSSLTGKYVGLGTATIEAMLLGVPTVVNTPLDLLGTGLLVDGAHLMHSPNVEPAEIALKIKQLLTNQLLRQQIGEGGREFVQQYLNWEVVAQDMETVLNDLCTRKSKKYTEGIN